MTKIILSLIMSLYLGYSPLIKDNRHTDKIVQFVEAKKVKTGVYDVTVAFLDSNFNKIKINGCESVTVVFNYNTHIMKEPIWPKYYLFGEDTDYPGTCVLWPMTDKSDYKRYKIPFDEIQYEKDYKAN